MTAATHHIQADVVEIERALRLMIPPGQVTELRAIDATAAGNRYPHVVSGYYDDLAKMAQDAAAITAKGVYFTPNPVKPALLARSANRCRPAGKNPTTADHDIEHRQWLLIDCDPVRPAGISSTDEEHQDAIELAYRIRAELSEAGWPDPISADSGNGAHLLYKVYLPADDAGLVSRCLEALDLRYSNSTVKIDTTVHNAARIWKLTGTVAAKGDSTPDRPHRLARVLEHPPHVKPVARELLEELAASVPQPEAAPTSPSRNGHASFDIAAFVPKHFPDAIGPDAWKGTGQRWVLPSCPFNSDHTDNSAFIVVQPSGAIGAGCSHNSCTWGWSELRQKLEPKSNGKAKRRRENRIDATGLAPQEELPQFANAIRISSGESTETVTFSMSEVVERAHKLTGGELRRLGARLFVHDHDYGVCYFGKPAELFGWLGRLAKVEWYQSAGCVTREEFFAELLRTAPAVKAVEEYPHFPPIADHFYACPAVVPGDGKRLAELMERFCPETLYDGDLLLAAVVTPFWGGPPGSRPAFALTSAHGRGAGKSSAASAIGALAGGTFDLSLEETFEAIKTRMLTREASSKRTALLDNLKTHKVSRGEIEGLITAREISGRQLYVGEGSRPNMFTWLLTINGPAMSRDFAQRCVIIKLAKPKYNGGWLAETYEFIEEHRWEIIADVAAYFTREPVKLERFSRWGGWERDVLARLAEPEELQQIIADRQGEIDADSDEASGIEDHFAQHLERLGYDPAVDTVHIPNALAAEWYGQATAQRISPTALGRSIHQGSDEGTLRRLQVDPSRTHGRGLLWRGSDFTVHRDIEERRRTSRVTGDEWWDR